MNELLSNYPRLIVLLDPLFYVSLYGAYCLHQVARGLVEIRRVKKLEVDDMTYDEAVAFINEHNNTDIGKL